MNIEKTLSEKTIEALQSLYGVAVEKITFERTNPDFEGDLTLVVFPFLKASKKKPEDTANEIGTYLKTNTLEIASFNVVKGFLNIVIDTNFWITYFNSIKGKQFIDATLPANAPTVMVEYSSPNTNKPLHLGHVRNNLLGYSVAEILKAAGNKVIKTNLVNDRGIHICKSMLAWQKWGGGETPESTGMKGDHLVGKYYVQFETELRKQIIPILENIENNILDGFSDLEQVDILNLLIDRKNYEENLELEINELDFIKIAEIGGDDAEIACELAQTENIKWKDVIRNYTSRVSEKIDINILESKQKKLHSALKSVIILEDRIADVQTEIIEIAKSKTALMLETQHMLRKWESGDKEIRTLWEMMNGWVYKGFEATYKMLGVDFDKTYYESNTYLLGKNIIDAGLAKNVLKRRADNSVYIDLTADGLDEKTLLRGDGTSVYMTQDLGTAVQREEEYHFNKLIYTVGNEQDYHFKVLFLILKKLDYKWAAGLHHLSYGMVELPEGKMKSREGTVVDADDLMQEMINIAAATTKELGKVEGLTEEEAQHLYRTIGLGALKYFMLKVDPKKKMLFNPAESIDFNGNTAPFIQFNYVRIQALLRKAKENKQFENVLKADTVSILPKEKELIIKIYNFNSTIQQAASEYSPAVIANYVYDLAKDYSQYYHDTPILKEENKSVVQFRLHLSNTIGTVIKSSMKLLGIEVPERM